MSREKEFKADLLALLKKYNAELEVNITTGEYGCFIRSEIEVSINPIYDNGVCLEKAEYFNLPNHIYPEAKQLNE